MRDAVLGTALLACSLLAGCGDDGHRATGTMRLAPRLLVGDDEEAPESLSGPAIDALVETTLEEGRSAAVRERVAQRLELHRDPSFFAVSEAERVGWRGASMEETVRRLGARHTVERRAGSLVIEVGYRDPDPERAVQICNASMEALIELYVERRLGEITQRIDWLATQHESLLSELASARQEERAADATRIEATLATLTAELERLELDRQRRQTPLEVLDRCAVSAP